MLCFSGGLNLSVPPWRECPRVAHGVGQLRVPVVPALLQQGHPEQGAQPHVQAAAGDPQGGAPSPSLGSLFQGSGTRPAQQCFLRGRGHLLGSRLGPGPLGLALGTPEQSLAPASRHLPAVLVAMAGSPRSLLCSRPSSPSSRSLSSRQRCSRPFGTSGALRWALPRVPSSGWCWGAQRWAQHCRGGLSSAEQRGRITALGLLAALCLTQPRCRQPSW